MDAPRERLGQLIKARRLALGLTMPAAAEAVPIARNTWSGLERGTRRTASHLYAAIERVLRWQDGSIELVLAGGEAVELDRPERAPTTDAELVREIERIKGLPLPPRERLAALKATIDLYAEIAREAG